MKHYHVIMISWMNTIPNVITPYEKTARKYFIDRVFDFCKLTGFIPVTWTTHKVRFREETIIRYFECDGDCWDVPEKDRVKNTVYDDRLV